MQIKRTKWKIQHYTEPCDITDETDDSTTQNRATLLMRLTTAYTEPCDITDEAGDRLQFSGEFVEQIHVRFVLQNTKHKKSGEVLQLLYNLEAKKSVQPSQTPRSNSMLHTQ